MGFRLGWRDFNPLWLYIPLEISMHDNFYPFAVTPQIWFTANPNPVAVNGDTTLECVITAEPSTSFSEIFRIFPDGDEEMVTNVSNPTGDREFLLRYTFRRVRFPRDHQAMFECRSINAKGPADPLRITIIVQGEPLYRLS
jgi:hypothetical protein